MFHNLPNVSCYWTLWLFLLFRSILFFLDSVSVKIFMCYVLFLFLDYCWWEISRSGSKGLRCGLLSGIILILAPISPHAPVPSLQTSLMPIIVCILAQLLLFGAAYSGRPTKLRSVRHVHGTYAFPSESMFYSINDTSVIWLFDKCALPTRF